MKEESGTNRFNNEEPVKYEGNTTANLDYHHGRLQPILGVQSFQAMRANRENPEDAEGYGWTYNHQPYLAYWNDTFFLHYLSGEVHEHEGKSHTLLMSSDDGINWSKPKVIFPVYPVSEGSNAIMHQRMGFYVTSKNKLLVLGFYGLVPCPENIDMPNDGRGIGRVVREVYSDGSLSPIYFIRYNLHAGWNESNTAYPHFAKSEDKDFVEACHELLENKLITQQWWEEDRSKDGFYSVEGNKALVFYQRKDGKTVGLWKWSKAALSEDGGYAWTDVADIPSVINAGGKIWAEKTSDDKYVLVYNPSTNNDHRWPLALSISNDGISFDKLLLVNGEVPPLRYRGSYKSYGHNYVRGIIKGNGVVPDGNCWVTYSMNKEDIWITKIPVPIRVKEDNHLHEDFDKMDVGQQIINWNTYSTKWAEVSIIEGIKGKNKCLSLRDCDPYDYAKAERLFPESNTVDLQFGILAHQNHHGSLHIDVQDALGSSHFSIFMDSKGLMKIVHGSGTDTLVEYLPDIWYDISIHIDAINQKFSCEVYRGKKPFEQPDRSEAISAVNRWFMAPVRSVERITFSTGKRNYEPNLFTEMDRYNDMKGRDLPSAGNKIDEVKYYVGYLKTSP